MRGIFESLIVFGVMTGLLLPARLLFVEYISNNWFGSLGIISAISILVIILARKKKLGFFGPMFERQIYKFQKGKRGLLVIGESVFVLLMLGSMIFAIDQGNSVYSDIKLQTIENSPPTNPEQILELTNEWEASDWIVGFLMVPVMFITAFPQMSAGIASVDQSLDGWLMHFYTVGFIEYLELFGILIYYKISFRKKLQSPVKSTLYTKAAL
ncbi:MAG: hypothetical protein OES23_00435 [Nitrosopumilus sp.]|nr:hypothetical protein [Nitrosopumilus sp.]